MDVSMSKVLLDICKEYPSLILALIFVALCVATDFAGKTLGEKIYNTLFLR